MGFYLIDDAYDELFNYIAECDRQDLVSDAATPTTLTNSLANVAMVGGDYSIAAGGSGGRTLTVAEKTLVPVTADGTTRHAVLSKETSPGVYEIRAVKTCVEREVSATHLDEVNMKTHDLHISDPTLAP